MAPLQDDPEFKIVNFAFCPEAYKSAKKTERNSGRSTEPKSSVKNGPEVRDVGITKITNHATMPFWRSPICEFPGRNVNP